MIHWSIIPSEMTFGMGNTPTPHYEECMIDGVQMLVEIDSSGQAKIARLLSPNPQDYLNPRFQPGNPIRLHATLELDRY